MNQSASSPVARMLLMETARGEVRYLTQPMPDGPLRHFTWRQAMAEARSMASYLHSLDLPAGSRVAILSRNCAHWILADWAIWLAGHVSVPLYPTLGAETVGKILNHAEASVVFVGRVEHWESVREAIPDACLGVALPGAPDTEYSDWDQIVSTFPPKQEVVPAPPEALATIVYTSGSTGDPKGVMISFGAMAYAAENLVDVMALTPKDRMLSYLPLAHVYERFVVEMGSLYGGCRVRFNTSLGELVAALKDWRPTVFMGVPRIWSKFQARLFQELDVDKLERRLKVPVVKRGVGRRVLKFLGLDQVRYAGSGSAPLSEELRDWYRQLGLDILEGYGLTENFAYSHLSRPGRARSGYVGEPLPGVEVRIGEESEVLVKSPTNLMGYYKDEVRSQRVLTGDGFLRTGDQGELDSMGRLRITGRLKEQFKTSGGKYVAPVPIETRLTAHPDVELACVAGADQNSPHALLMLTPEARDRVEEDGEASSELEYSLKTLLETVNDELERHERLQFMVIVRDQWAIDNDFLTPTMKIRRTVLEDNYEEEVDQWYDDDRVIIWQSDVDLTVGSGDEESRGEGAEMQSDVPEGQPGR